MRFKIGDKVKIKSLEWYNNHRNKNGEIRCGDAYFQPTMSKFCGNILTIKNIDTFLNTYEVEENSYYWTDEMLEENVEEEGIYDEEFVNAINTAYHACLDEYNEVPNKIDQVFISDKNYQDKVELCLGKDYEIVVEGNKTFVQKKKQPQYPTTYEECCDVLKIPKDERYIDIDVPLSYNNPLYKFTELLICRDAYWKIAGEEMGLDKPWEPDYNHNNEKYVIYPYQYLYSIDKEYYRNTILAFPTEEMRDAFYENFKELIEKCKELL